MKAVAVLAADEVFHPLYGCHHVLLFVSKRMGSKEW